MGSIGGNHRAMEPMATQRGVTGRAAQRMRAALPVAGLVGVAVAGAAVIGGTPSLTAATELAAKTYYLRGTNIGTVPPDDQYAAWTDAVIDQTVGTHDPAEKVPYPGGFWFFSKGGFSDPTYDKSVAEGLATLKDMVGDDTGVVTEITAVTVPGTDTSDTTTTDGTTGTTTDTTGDSTTGAADDEYVAFFFAGGLDHILIHKAEYVINAKVVG